MSHASCHRSTRIDAPLSTVFRMMSHLLSPGQFVSVALGRVLTADSCSKSSANTGDVLFLADASLSAESRGRAFPRVPEYVGGLPA